MLASYVAAEANIPLYHNVELVKYRGRTPELAEEPARLETACAV